MPDSHGCYERDKESFSKSGKEGVWDCGNEGKPGEWPWRASLNVARNDVNTVWVAINLSKPGNGGIYESGNNACCESSNEIFYSPSEVTTFTQTQTSDKSISLCNNFLSQVTRRRNMGTSLKRDEDLAMVHGRDLSRKWTGGQVSEEKEEEEIPVGFHIAPRACTSEQPSRPPAPRQAGLRRLPQPPIKCRFSTETGWLRAWPLTFQRNDSCDGTPRRELSFSRDPAQFPPRRLPVTTWLSEVDTTIRGTAGPVGPSQIAQ